MGGEGESAAPETEEAGGADEQPLVIVPTAKGYLGDGGAAEGDGVGGEVADGVGAVSIGHLIEAGAVATGGDVELAALGRATGQGGVGGGGGRVEEGVGLLVAVGAGLTLRPRHIAPCVQHHVLRPRRAADSNAGEVLPAPLARPRDHRPAQTIAAGRRHGVFFLNERR